MLFLLPLVAAGDLRRAEGPLVATAFTVGHSLTLAIASLDLFRVSRQVEFLIGVTILAAVELENRCIQRKQVGDLRHGGGVWVDPRLGVQFFFRISRTSGARTWVDRRAVSVRPGGRGDQLVIVSVIVGCGDSLVRSVGVSARAPASRTHLCALAEVHRVVVGRHWNLLPVP